jgi:hypothetical protein
LALEHELAAAGTPGSPSRSVSAGTVITSGKAAGMKVDASTAELPAATTVMSAPTDADRFSQATIGAIARVPLSRVMLGWRRRC